MKFKINPDKEYILIDIDNIDQWFDTFAVAKRTIESEIQKDNPDYQRKPLTDFLYNLKFNSVYIKDGEVMPFSIYETSDTTYIFYCGVQNRTKASIMIKYIADMLYNPQYQPYEITTEYMLQNGLDRPSDNVFLFDGKYYEYK